MARSKGTWKKGQSGNPAGKKRGTRNQFSQEFIADIYDAWLKNGATVIDTVIREDPVAFLKVAAGVVPRESKITQHHIIEQLESMTDEQLLAGIRDDIRRIESRGIAIAANEDIGKAAETKKAL